MKKIMEKKYLLILKIILAGRFAMNHCFLQPATTFPTFYFV
jgi:hypothetical protein